MGLTILLVEDDRLVADAVRGALEAEGWRVVACADACGALNRLASALPCDLLITDKGLPDADGLEVVRYARSLPRHRTMPILMLTGADCEAEALRAGVDVFLKKPEGLGELVCAAARLLDRGA